MLIDDSEDVAVPGFAVIGLAVMAMPPIETIGLWTEVCKTETTWSDAPVAESTIKYCGD